MWYNDRQQASLGGTVSDPSIDRSVYSTILAVMLAIPSCYLHTTIPIFPPDVASINSNPTISSPGVFLFLIVAI